MCQFLESPTMKPPSLVLFLLLAGLCLPTKTLISYAQTTTKDTLKPGDVLTHPNQLASSNGKFRLGFFSATNSKNVYLGIRYYDDSYADRPVWVANRDRPIYSSNPNFTFDASESELRIEIGNDGSIPVVSSKNLGGSNVTARLEDSGNLVVAERDPDGSFKEVLWQSFDYPTDTLLPGMRIGVDLEKNRKWSLVSWISPQLAAPGAFALEWSSIEDGSPPQLVLRRRGEIYWTSGAISNNNTENAPTLSSSPFSYSFTTVSNKTMSYFSYNIKNEQTPFWLLNSDGGLYDSSRVYLLPPGICDGNASASQAGCGVQEWPKCRKKDEYFEATRGHFEIQLSWFDGNSSIGLSDCREVCWRNCSCVGYGSYNYENETGCVFWSGELEFTYGANEMIIYKLRAHQDSGNNWWIWVTIALVVALALALLGLFCYLRKKKLQEKKRRDEEEILFELTTSKRFSDEREIGNDGKKGHDLVVFSFDSILVATNNFSPQNKLGQGGFGPVYKGKLPDGQEIAVKRLSRSSGQGLVEFKNELVLIAKLQHMNLVRLLGCCVKGDEKMLVYEYMPNKSLDFFLFDSDKRELLDWKRRYDILEGIAQGLLYLHKYSRLRIIHRDLKVSNILLDADMNPKISDFGLARIFGRNESEANTNRVVGTYGYMSPEYAMEGNFSEKSDVYSFGVLLLEIVSGRKNGGFHYKDRPLNIVGYTWELWKEGRTMELVDSMLLVDPSHQPQILRCIEVGLLCVQESAMDRPSMSEVISMLTTNQTLPLPNPKQTAQSLPFNEKKFMETNTLQPQEQESCSLTLTEIGGR